ncbi:MAG: alanine racemase [Polyangiaceae bacterium]
MDIGFTRRSRSGAPEGQAISRRLWLTATTALFASACAPEGPDLPPADERSLGQARSPDGSSPLPPPERFAAWNKELRLKAPGRDVVFVDLDAVDNNVAVVKAVLGPEFNLRIVTKSIPSLALLDYLIQATGTNKLMAFSEGLLRALLDHFGETVDILLGRPMPVEAATRVLLSSPKAARKVKWLVDTRERMKEYKGLSDSIHGVLDVAIELDVGLRRGGARTATELLEMLEIVHAHPKNLRFVGFMGYDGHVPFAPQGFDSDAEFAAVLTRYADFVAAAQQAYPALFAGDLTFNCGGTATHYRYGAGLSTVVNDVALGNGFLLPQRFSDLAALGFLPALFAASPVLKRIDPAEVPFAEGYLPMLAQNDPSLEVAYHVVAGGFPGDVVYPPGLVANPFIPSIEGVENLLPNQALWNGPRALKLAVGDFVFYYPWEGDALVWLDTAEIARSAKLVTRFPTFRDGCASNCGGPKSPGW